ncbi:family 47 putative glycoside hydrolase [Triangularia verruculosa]|uniref:alpha-1,2-Mannosidase n=1 Tax=Triangularia verruculosa TaxID=2587418 RepID=A0AAN6XDT6_9PEZI|nr:family 47 putative glycoside hydrolase [Triangularia verruculosa]
MRTANTMFKDKPEGTGSQRPLPQRPHPAFSWFSRRSERLLVIFTFFLVVFYMLGGFEGAFPGDPESVRLERHMNAGTTLYPYETKKSSIDWGKVVPRYPPRQTLTQPPTVPAGSVRAQIQHRFKKESANDRKKRDRRRRAVRDLAIQSWSAYRKYAWKKDALLPLSATGKDQFSGWAATLVDSLDTLWIIGLREEFDEAVAAVAEIDFANSSTPLINIFETNIRYLGGLLAAYDLSKREVLLQKATELGDLIYAGFDTPTRMPVDNINLLVIKSGEGQLIEPQVVSASPGTLSLELTRLSQLTGDPKYYSAIARLNNLFHVNQNRTLLPGLFPMYISLWGPKPDVTSGTAFTLGGGADSMYEYFPKLSQLLNGAEPSLLSLTHNFLTSASANLFFRPMIPDPASHDILISGTANILPNLDTKKTSIHLNPETEHLTCFIGGTYALTGRLVSSPEYLETGARLTRGCVYMYKSFPTGLMPERLTMLPCPSNHPSLLAASCQWNQTLWDETEKQPGLPKGFVSSTDRRYILRPEAIESVFYMWRITGEKEWQEAAWDMFLAVANATFAKETGGGASVKDVTIDPSMEEIQRDDEMESFWIAETLKYFYLVFSPPDLISLDKYVLNTEAHPFLVTSAVIKV